MNQLGILMLPFNLWFNSQIVQLSSLTDGSFERQLDMPVFQNLEPATPLMEKSLETYAQLPFDVGERMKFLITYMGAKGGTAEVNFRTPIRWKNTWAHRITGEVKSATWYSWIMKIHDGVEGLMDDSAELSPLHFYINQRENNFMQSKIVHFEPETSKIKQITKRKDKPEKNEEFNFVKGSKDALGALYFFRKHVPTGEGIAKFEIPIFTSEKTWTAIAQLQGQEKKEVEGIVYDTDVYRLTTHFGGLMEQKGDIRIWLTRDTRRLPVYTEAAILFGSIKVALVEWDQGYADGKRKKLFEPIRTGSHP